MKPAPSKDHPSEEEHYRELQRQNMRVLVIVVLLLVFGAWLVDA